MRILVYSLNYAPEMVGIAKYNTELVDWLTLQGHEAQVICAPPYYPSWKISTHYASWKYQLDHCSTTPIYRCPIWVPSRPTGLKRILHLFSFAISSAPMLFWRSLAWQPDFIFILEPPFFCLPWTLLVSKLFDIKVWLHVQDFELDAGFSLGIMPNWPMFQTMVGFFEGLLMRQTAIVSTISQEMLKRLRRKGVSAEKSVLFPNWVDISTIHPLDHTSPIRKELDIKPDQIVCLYSGNLGAKQGLDILIGAARQLQKQTKIAFVIAGDGPAKRSLMDLASDLVNVQFLDLQPIERLNDLLNMADIHLLPQSTEAADLVLPSKLKAMFASGRPVVTTADLQTDLAQIVLGRGLVVPPGNVDQLSQGILHLSRDLDLRLRLGRAARNYALIHWDRNNILAKIEEKFQDLLVQNNNPIEIISNKDNFIAPESTECKKI
ncbi:MAG: glycosyltransferase WbuB [Thermosynechococcaceae cyanobacterium]